MAGETLVQEPIRTVYGDGTIIISNVRNKFTNETTSYQVVTTWHDGTPMTDAKKDAFGVYTKFTQTGEYLREVLPNWGINFLEVDTVAKLRSLDGRSVQLLKVGYYKGVRLNGYFAKGDTPRYIEYFLTSTSLADNGINIFQVGTIKVQTVFKGFLDSRNGGFFPQATKPTLAAFVTQQTAFEKVRDFCIDNQLDLRIPTGYYALNVFRTGYAAGKMKINIIGENGVEVYLKSNANPVMVQFWKDCRVTGINFYSLEPDLNNQRAAIEGVNGVNIYLERCGFFNFLNPTMQNSWGLYISACDGVTLDTCVFGNNTQSDITIVDGGKNIRIINCMNVINGGLYLNVEPNANTINQNIQIQGGKYRRINLLTNTNTANAIQNMSIIGCEVDWMMYDGADVEFIGTQIKRVSNQEFVFVPLGVLDWNLRFGSNIIKDPYLLDFDYNDTARDWKPSFGSPLAINRVNKDYTTLGDRSLPAGTMVIKTDFIPVDYTKKYLIMVNGRGNYYNTINNVARFCRIKLFDANKQPLVITKPVGTAQVPTNYDWIEVSAFRFPSGQEGTTGFLNQVGILEFEQYAPLTRFITVEVGNYSSNAHNEYDIKFFSINEIQSFEKGESISSYISRKLPNGTYSVSSTPPNNAIANRIAGLKTGDIIKGANGRTWIVKDGSVRPPVVQEINADATITAKGIVKKATTPSGTLNNVGATYSQTEVQAIINRIKSLETALQNAEILTVPTPPAP